MFWKSENDPEIANTLDLRIVPPVTSSSNEVSIEIINGTGHLIRATGLGSKAVNSLDTSDLAPGYYVARISAGERWHYIPFIKR